MEHPEGHEHRFCSTCMNGLIIKESGLALCKTLGGNIHIRSWCFLELCTQFLYLGSKPCGSESNSHMPLSSREIRSNMTKEKRGRVFYQVACMLQTFQIATDFMLNS